MWECRSIFTEVLSCYCPNIESKTCRRLMVPIMSSSVKVTAVLEHYSRRKGGWVKMSDEGRCKNIQRLVKTQTGLHILILVLPRVCETMTGFWEEALPGAVEIIITSSTDRKSILTKGRVSFFLLCVTADVCRCCYILGKSWEILGSQLPVSVSLEERKERYMRGRKVKKDGKWTFHLLLIVHTFCL